MHTFAIQPYNLQGDGQQVYALWQRTLGDIWPLSQAAFHRVTLASDVYQPGGHLVGLARQEVVGFVGTQAWLVPGERTPRGELMLMMVDPAYQWRGIGRTLLERALIVLKERGAEEVQIGVCLHFYQEVMGQGGHADVVLARHPDHGIVAGYPVTDLCDLTHGRGTFTLEFRRYDLVPDGIAEGIVAQRQAEGKVPRR